MSRRERELIDLINELAYESRTVIYGRCTAIYCRMCGAEQGHIEFADNTKHHAHCPVGQVLKVKP